MKFIWIVFVFSIASFHNEVKAIKGADSLKYSAAIKKQAETMADLLMKKDYKVFAKFTYPKIVEMMGGEEKMVAAMTEGLKEMESGGFGILKVTIGNPSGVISERDELQCTLPQKIEMKIPDGKMLVESTLIAVSQNKGLNWYFIDTSGKDIDTMQGMLPNLSDELVIPKSPAPVMSGN